MVLLWVFDLNEFQRSAIIPACFQGNDVVSLFRRFKNLTGFLKCFLFQVEVHLLMPSFVSMAQ